MSSYTSRIDDHGAQMHEETLRRFMVGELGADELEKDLQDSVVTELTTSVHDIIDMDEPFELVPGHLVRICDAVSSGDLAPGRLQQIGFCLIASDQLFWEAGGPGGEAISQTLHEWAAPWIFYPLSAANARKWKMRLEEGNDAFGDATDTSRS